VKRKKTKHGVMQLHLIPGKIMIQLMFLVGMQKTTVILGETLRMMLGVVIIPLEKKTIGTQVLLKKKVMPGILLKIPILTVIGINHLG
jgi:hypothetical protein